MNPFSRQYVSRGLRVGEAGARAADGVTGGSYSGGGSAGQS